MSAPSPQATVDGSCYRHAGSMGFARCISTVARRRMRDLFMWKMQPKHRDRILDIGTSDDTDIESNGDLPEICGVAVGVHALVCSGAIPLGGTEHQRAAT